MTTFDDRERAFEEKFKHDQDLQFRVENRRNKLLGLWIAEMIGKTGDDAEAYAREVVVADFDEPGIEDVVRKVTADLTSHDVELSEHRLRNKLDELLDVAKKQVMEE